MSARRFSDTYLDDIRQRLPISSVVGRDVEWDNRKSKPSRGDLWACCPIHQENSPSFHVQDAKGTYYCFGCHASGDVFSYATDRLGMGFPDAVKWLAGLAGIGPETDVVTDPEAERRLEAQREAYSRKRAEGEAKEARRVERRLSKAEALWKSSLPLVGTPGEAYFNNRGILMSEWSSELRFAPEAEWEPGAKVNGTYTPGPLHPAVICRVKNAAGESTGLWRIFIRPDGSGKADLEPNKLGMGPCKGGAVRLSPLPDDGEIGIAEGVETALAVQLITGRPCWAGLSTSGVSEFEPPFDVTKIRVFPDGDLSRRDKNGKWHQPPGMLAAEGLKARMDAIGLPCVIEPAPTKGRDFLDIWSDLQRRRNGKRR